MKAIDEGALDLKLVIQDDEVCDEAGFDLAEIRNPECAGLVPRSRGDKVGQRFAGDFVNEAESVLVASGGPCEGSGAL